MNDRTRTNPISRHALEMGRSPRRRPDLSTRPECSLLEGRQLLTAATTLIPSAALVADANAVLVKKAGADDAKFVAELAVLERTSVVTAAEFNVLIQDNAGIDAAIRESHFSAAVTASKIDYAADYIDESFVDIDEATLQNELRADLTGVKVSTPILRQAFYEMDINDLQSATRISAANRALGEKDLALVTADLGSNPSTIVWAGEPRSPIAVYYDGQVSKFVH